MFVKYFNHCLFYLINLFCKGATVISSNTNLKFLINIGGECKQRLFQIVTKFIVRLLLCELIANQVIELF